MKKLLFILMSTLLLASCDAGSNDITTNTSSTSSLGESTTTTSITSSDVTSTTSSSSSSSTSTTSSGSTSSYTYETIIKYISEQLFGTDGKHYSYDKDYDQYYTTLTFQDSQALTKEDGLTALVALSNLPSEFTCVESSVLDEFDDGTPLIYSLYQSGNLFVEFDTYEDVDSSNNVVAVNGQVFSYYE